MKKKKKNKKKRKEGFYFIKKARAFSWYSCNMSIVLEWFALFWKAFNIRNISKLLFKLFLFHTSMQLLVESMIWEKKIYF
jgi:hypothetical protein